MIEIISNRCLGFGFSTATCMLLCQLNENSSHTVHFDESFPSLAFRLHRQMGRRLQQDMDRSM